MDLLLKGENKQISKFQDKQKRLTEKSLFLHWELGGEDDDKKRNNKRHNQLCYNNLYEILVNHNSLFTTQY